MISLKKNLIKTQNNGSIRRFIICWTASKFWYVFTGVLFSFSFHRL